MFLCVKAEDEKSAGESKPEQEKDKHDEKKGDSEEGAGSAGKFNTNLTRRRQFYQNMCSIFKLTNLTPKQSNSQRFFGFFVHCFTR